MAGAASRTTLVLDERRVAIEQSAVSALGGWSWPSGWALRGSLGAVLGGQLEHDGRRHDLGAGVVGGVSLSRQWTIGPWFVTGSFGASASRASTLEDVVCACPETIIGTDARVGAMAGRTFGVVSPYVLARAFGGPVLWKLDGASVTGTDAHHYQLGGGVSVTAPAGWSLLVDVSALGERSASLGASLRL